MHKILHNKHNKLNYLSKEKEGRAKEGMRKKAIAKKEQENRIKASEILYTVLLKNLKFQNESYLPR